MKLPASEPNIVPLLNMSVRMGQIFPSSPLLWHPSPPVFLCPSGPRGCVEGLGPGDILPASLQTDPAVLDLGSEGVLRDV